jgi:predicted dehydrogenase
MLTFDDVNLSEPLRIYDKQVTTERSEAAFVDDFSAFRMIVREGDIHVPHVSMSQPLKNECEHFLDCVIDGKKPRSGGAEGLAVVKTLEAISASREDNGSQVEVGL